MTAVSSPQSATTTASRAGAHHPNWSPAGIELIRRLDPPLAAGGPVSYKREFVEHYIPGESWLMQEDMADELHRLYHLRAPTVSIDLRKAFAQQFVDLSWNSSRSEGNRYSPLAAEVPLSGGAIRCGVDTVMLLNHKAANEFLVDCIPEEGLSSLVIRNLHAILMLDLVPDNGTLGAIRKGLVGIAGTLYLPPQEPHLLEAMLKVIFGKTNLIKNPIEAALFLSTQLAYLQPFEHGNGCTSRIAANISLLLHNCAPLAFQDFTREDYARSTLTVYELRDATLAGVLLSWINQQSVRKSAVAGDA